MDTPAVNIIPVNLAEIDKELFEISDKLKPLLDRKTQLLNVRDYVASLGTLQNFEAPHIVKEKPTDNALEISDFLLLALKNAPLDNGQLNKLYAAHINQPISSVKNNVSNALTRLKKLGLITREIKGNGPKSGSICTITEKGLESVMYL